MESLYLLIPLSVGLVLVVIAVFGWAINDGQFDDLEAEGERILGAGGRIAADEAGLVDADQGATRDLPKQSPHGPDEAPRGGA